MVLEDSALNIIVILLNICFFLNWMLYSPELVSLQKIELKSTEIRTK